MPSNVKIKQLPSGNFNALVFDYTDSSGKRHYKSITAPSKREVKQLIAEFLAKRDENRETIPDITVGDAIDKYIASKTNILSPSTISGYTSIRKTRLCSIIDTPIKKLSIADIQAAINLEADGHSPKTVRNINALLRSSLELAMPSFKYNVTLPQKIKPDIQIPTDDEMKAVFEAIKDTPMEVPVYLAALCGMRRSEIAALKWSDVDLKKERITINAASVLDKDRNLVRKTTKTTSGKRIIKIFKPVLTVLKSQEKTGEYVLTVTPNVITNEFPRLLKKLGLPHYRFHDLRHYAVSTMLFLNMPKKNIAEYVGHETEHMIDTVYGHVMRDKKDTFLDVVDVHFDALFGSNAK